jgi:hypothetical protein
MEEGQIGPDRQVLPNFPLQGLLFFHEKDLRVYMRGKIAPPHVISRISLEKFNYWGKWVLVCRRGAVPGYQEFHQARTISFMG